MQGARGGAEVHDDVDGPPACVCCTLDQLLLVQVLIPLHNFNPANVQQLLLQVYHGIVFIQYNLHEFVQIIHVSKN